MVRVAKRIACRIKWHSAANIIPDFGAIYITVQELLHHRPLPRYEFGNIGV